MLANVSVSNIRNITVLLVLLLVGSGCASNKKVKLAKPTPLTKIENQLSIKKQWSRDIGKLEKQSFYVPYIAVDENAIYASDVNRVTAIDKATGRKLWNTKIKRSHLTGSTGIAPNQVLVGDDEGYVYSLDKTTGKSIWQAQVFSEIIAPPAGDGDIVVVLAGDGQIYGFNAIDGVLRWATDTTKPILLSSGISPPVIVKGTVYIAQDNGKVLALKSSDGVRLWEARVAIPQGDNELDRLVDIDGAPLFHSGSLYAASFQGGIMGINVKTGRAEWVKKISTRNPLAASGGTLVAIDVDGLVKAFSVANGTLLWEKEALKYRKLSAPIVTPDYIATIDYKGYLHVLGRKDGRILARRKVTSKGTVAPLVYNNDRLYFLDKKGKLQSYSISPL